MPLTTKRQAAWDEIDAGRHSMAAGIGTILDRLRADYIQINIHKTNEKVWKAYLKFQREVDDRWGSIWKREKRKKK